MKVWWYLDIYILDGTDQINVFLPHRGVVFFDHKHTKTKNENLCCIPDPEATI